MRIKIVVGVIVLLAVGALIVSRYSVTTPFPADHQQFSLNRQHIAKDMLPTLLLPERVGAFARKAITPIEAETNGDLQGSATYEDALGEQFDIGVLKPARGVQGWFPLKAGYYDYHTDTEFPYGYSTSQGMQNFIWINGDWVISIGILQAFPISSDQLVQFVNAYPF